MARALVVPTFMNAELPKMAPSGVPIMMAYSPCTGLAPARTPEARASGMFATPVVRPATRSPTRLRRDVATGTFALMWLDLPFGFVRRALYRRPGRRWNGLSPRAKLEAAPAGHPRLVG